MNMNRREFLAAAAGGAAIGVLPFSGLAQLKNHLRYKAVAFDAFPIFDPRPVFALTTELVPGKGEELVGLWRTRQFEYTWLRTLSGHYVDFPTVTRDALEFAAKSLKVELSPSTRLRLLDSYFQLKAWPDVVPALRRLKEAGLRLGFLSNFSHAMLATNIKSAGLDGYFEQLLSTDQVRAFKPLIVWVSMHSDSRQVRLSSLHLLVGMQQERSRLAIPHFGSIDKMALKKNLRFIPMPSEV